METENLQHKPSFFYIAVTLYESSSDASDIPLLYEETFTLIVASSQEDAESKAVELVNEPNTYKNVYGETITWSLKEIVVVQHIFSDAFTHGTEIFSRFFRNYEVYHLAFLNAVIEESAIEDAFNKKHPIDSE